MTTDHQISTAPRLHDDVAPIFRIPPGRTALPRFDRGWVTGATPEPYLSFADIDPSVNWSDELENLHEEPSRTHFLDQWTRAAILEGLGPVEATPVIADVGCSTGYLLEDLHATHPAATLIGVDRIGAGLIKAHRLVPSARLLCADACDLPIADGAVDAVVSANLLEHVPDDRKALREFARILRPGGRSVIVVPAGPRTYDYYDRFLGHERRYDRHELASKCAEAGLDVLVDRHIASLLYPPFWVVKQRNRRAFGRLEGDALQRRVSADISRTHNSRIGELAWAVERWLLNLGARLPFGIRSLVVALRPEGTP